MPSDSEFQQLLDERDIRNVLHRYAKGVDRFDWELVRASFHPDAVLEYGAKTTPEAFIAGASVGLANYALTQHAISNVIIEVDGDYAHAQSYCLARHRTPSRDGGAAIDFLWGGRYVDRFVRRDGAWRIAHRVVVHEWTALETVEATWPNAAAFTQGRRDREDISYAPWRPVT